MSYPLLETPLLETPLLETPLLETPLLETPLLETPACGHPSYCPPNLQRTWTGAHRSSIGRHQGSDLCWSQDAQCWGKSSAVQGSSLNDAQTTILDSLPAPAAAFPLPQLRSDFNGDGQMDLLWRDYTTGKNTVWFMQGTAQQIVVDLPTESDLNWRIEGVDDFNGDGRSDILWQNGATGEVRMWLMAGTTRLETVDLATILDLNWQIQGTGDLNSDGQTDILWRNSETGTNAVWSMQGSSVLQVQALPEALGSNLRMQGTGDFNGDGQTDILWRNYLSGENTLWLMQGTNRLDIQSLPTVADINWQVQAVDDFNRDGRPDIIWRQVQSGSNYLWLLNGTAVSQELALPAEANLQAAIARQTLQSNLAVASNLIFSGQEGDTGTFQIQLSQAPTTDVVVTLTPDSWLTVDADGTVQNGTQSTLTFTPQNWNQPRTVWFIAEKDGLSANRSSTLIRYSLDGGRGGVYDLGAIANTYAPDPNRFNIDLDFRNDYLGFWTPARRAIAQTAANDWARAIANEWTDFILNNAIQQLDSPTAQPYSFTANRYVDDLVVFINEYTSSGGGEPALGGPDYTFGGWITTPNALMPRVGQIAVSSALLANQPDLILYQVVAHEIGHTLGLLGLNWIGFSLQDSSNPKTATFLGPYSQAANGGNYVALQSQDGGDFFHPSNAVRSIMSYGWIYNPQTTSPTAVDYAMLADSGYQVYGVNA